MHCTYSQIEVMGAFTVQDKLTMNFTITLLHSMANCG